MLIAGSVVQSQINSQKLARTIGGYSTTAGSVICIIFGIAVLLFGVFGLYSAIKDHHRFLTLYSIVMFVVFIIQFITGVVGLSVKNSSKFPTYVQNVFQSEFTLDTTAKVERDFYQKHFECCGWNGPIDYTVNGTFAPPTSCCKAQTCNVTNVNDLFDVGCAGKLTNASMKVIDSVCGILVAFAVFNAISIVLSVLHARQIKRGYQYS
jgi:hypothetical protein